MIRVLSVDVFNLQDDVVFNNPAVVLYAAGCKWKCKYCHSKNTWDFNQGYELASNDMIRLLKELQQYSNDITLVGEGGDFYFQLENWFDFIRDVKTECPFVKVVWSTGASFKTLKSIFSKLKPDYKQYFDAILCERPFFKENKVNRKTLYVPLNDTYKEVIITPEGGMIDAKLVSQMEA